MHPTFAFFFPCNLTLFHINQSNAPNFCLLDREIKYYNIRKGNRNLEDKSSSEKG
ncbi:hypothetical protein LguiA_028833 [Lonicera macranthoides]